MSTLECTTAGCCGEAICEICPCCSRGHCSYEVIVGDPEPDPFAGRTLQSLAKSLTHHENRLKGRMEAAEKLEIHVRIWPGGPAADRLAVLRGEMAEDWEHCKAYCSALTRRLAYLMEWAGPNTMGLSNVSLGESSNQWAGKQGDGSPPGSEH